LIAAALAMSVPAFAAEPAVRFESGRLWVRTKGQVDVQRLLESITDRTGVEFLIDPALAAERVALQIDGLELERALRQLVAKIPKAGGQTMSYASSGSGEPHLARVTVLRLGGESPAISAPAGAGSAEAAVVAAPELVSASALEANKRQMIESGVPEETADEFNEIMSAAARAQRTPGATEEIMRSERFREVTRAIAEAQGKATKMEAEPPSP
jgi:hypothetical protein